MVILENKAGIILQGGTPISAQSLNGPLLLEVTSDGNPANLEDDVLKEVVTQEPIDFPIEAIGIVIGQSTRIGNTTYAVSVQPYRLL
jgi:hypothetical protein